MGSMDYPSEKAQGMAGSSHDEERVSYWKERAENAEAENTALTKKVEVLREALENLHCEANDLSSHEIDGGAPDNRWEDMRVALIIANKALTAAEKE